MERKLQNRRCDTVLNYRLTMIFFLFLFISFFFFRLPTRIYKSYTPTRDVTGNFTRRRTLKHSMVTRGLDVQGGFNVVRTEN